MPTNVYNWSSQPFGQNYDIASHPTYVVCFNFIRKWRDLKFKADTELQIFRETIHHNCYLLSVFLPEICWEEVAEEIFLYISVCSRDLQFKVDSKRQIFWETFHGNFNFLSEILPEICWVEIVEEILFVFCFDVWPGPRTLALRLISQHTTY